MSRRLGDLHRTVQKSGTDAQQLFGGEGGRFPVDSDVESSHRASIRAIRPAEIAEALQRRRGSEWDGCEIVRKSHRPRGVADDPWGSASDVTERSDEVRSASRVRPRRRAKAPRLAVYKQASPAARDAPT